MTEAESRSRANEQFRGEAALTAEQWVRLKVVELLAEKGGHPLNQVTTARTLADFILTGSLPPPSGTPSKA